MSPYRGLRSFVAGLAVLMACTDSRSVIVPTEDNYTDQIAIFREPFLESDNTPEEQPKNMVTQPAMVYYLEKARSLSNDPYGKKSQPRSPLTSRSVSALMGETSDETSEKLRGRQRRSLLATGEAMIHQRAAGFDDETPLDQTVFRKLVLDCVAGDIRKTRDHRCRFLYTNQDDEFEQKMKRREFVIDLGKRINSYRADLGKRFFFSSRK